MVLILLKFTVVIILFPQESLAKLVCTVDSLNPLLEAALNVAGVGVYDIKLFKYIEEAHIDYSAVQLLEADICHITKFFDNWQSFASRLAIQELLDEVIGAHSVEDLIVSELSQI